MADIRISDLLRMQHTLAETKGWLGDRTPEHAPMSILWSIDELGEAIAIIKKKGSQAIMDNESVREHFVEEVADVFMYLVDMMESYGITAEEFSDAYVGKFRRNMGRDWHENDAMYEKCRWKRILFTEGITLTEALSEFLGKTGVEAVFGEIPAETDRDTVICTLSEEAAERVSAAGMAGFSVSHTPADVADVQDFLFD